MLVAIPVVVTSTGYAAFSQNLSTHGTGTLPGYTTANSLSMTYTTSSSLSAGVYTYTIHPTLTYGGRSTITDWQMKFDLPADFTNLDCVDAVCSSSGQTVSAVNTGSNGTIAAGGQVTFTVSFQTASANYVLQNIDISGTEALVWHTIRGMNVTRTQGDQTFSGGYYLTPYTITVSNNSGLNLSAWRVQADWDPATNTVSSVPGGVTYSTSATLLTIMSTSGLANGASYQFTATLGSTSSTWNLPELSVQGAL